MDIADLQLVEAVAERGSFSAAAAALRLSQPSVSARIAAVERGIGASLFLRDSRGARLTPAGERYLGYLRRSLRLLADGAHAAAAETPQRPWMIGVPASYAAALAPLLIDAAERQRRAVTLRTGHSRHLRDELRDGRLDLAITTPGPLPSELASRHLIDSPIVTVASPHQAEPDRYAIHGWDEAGTGTLITELLGRGLPRQKISLVSPADTAIALALHHGYLAVVPQLAARFQLSCGALHLIDTGLPTLHASLEWLQPSHRRDTDPISELTHTVDDQLH
jgi:DNA-binding transcriptional LysR family regulator